MKTIMVAAPAALALRAPAFAADQSRPDLQLTPGAWNLPATPLQILCTPGYAATTRHVSRSLNITVYREYAIDPATVASGDHEIDHVVPLELDGSNAIQNLWPQDCQSAHRKDALENALRRLVCAGALSLAEAQTAIATDWPAAYDKYVGRR